MGALILSWFLIAIVRSIMNPTKPYRHTPQPEYVDLKEALSGDSLHFFNTKYDKKANYLNMNVCVPEIWERSLLVDSTSDIVREYTYDKVERSYIFLLEVNKLPASFRLTNTNRLLAQENIKKIINGVGEYSSSVTVEINKTKWSEIIIYKSDSVTKANTKALIYLTFHKRGIIVISYQVVALERGKLDEYFKEKLAFFRAMASKTRIFE